MAESLGFNFDTPVHDVSATSPTGAALPPSQGRTPQTLHTSQSGAYVAHAQSQKARMLVLYLELGASTDLALATILGLPDGRISARRNALVEAGLVVYRDIVVGPFKAKACRFELTVRGLHVAGKLRSAQR